VGINAQFRNPWSLTVDAAGNIYVADASNFTIRKITPNGTVTTLAGSAGALGSADGPANVARFWEPHGIAVDSSGTIWVVDSGNNTIRKITADGSVSTFAGQAGSPGNTDGTGADARFANPQGIALDGKGNIYVADEGNRRIRKISANGVVTTLPRLAGWGSTGIRPSNLAVDAQGNLFVVDTTASAVWKVNGK
jgi:sugar lactone lactonase YvrE